MLSREREIELLRFAASGEADYATDRQLTQLGHEGLWELEQVGTKKIFPPIDGGQSGWIDEWGVFRSRLTEAGKLRLKGLENA